MNLDLQFHALPEQITPVEKPEIEKQKTAKEPEKALVQAVEPSAAYLEIRGAVAGAQVKVDGRLIGETDAAGAIRHDVLPGLHTIQLTKEDYAQARVNEQFQAGKTRQIEGGRLAMTKLTKTEPPPDPKQAEAQEWAGIAISANPDEFDEFTRKHPGSSHLEQARTRSVELRQALQANALRQMEESVWEKVN
jgi:hypothetical protein